MILKNIYHDGYDLNNHNRHEISMSSKNRKIILYGDFKDGIKKRAKNCYSKI